jgi:FkbM family methyltransferase
MLRRIAKTALIVATLFFVASAGFLLALPHYPVLGLGWVWFRASGPKQCDFGELPRSSEYERRFQAAAQRIRAGSRLIQQDGDRQLWDIADFHQFWLSAKHDVNGKLDVQQSSAFAEQVVGQYYHAAVHVQPGDIVLDIGADHGDVTWKALQAGAQKVAAIEIDPVKWECLNRTFAAEIKEGRVVVVPVGVWDKEGTVELSGDSVIFDNHVSKKVVRVTTIDEIVAEEACIARRGSNAAKIPPAHGDRIRASSRRHHRHPANSAPDGPQLRGDLRPMCCEGSPLGRERSLVPGSIGPAQLVSCAGQFQIVAGQSPRLPLANYWSTTDGETNAVACCRRSDSSSRFSSAARCRAAISSSARRFASIRTWE